MKNGALCDADHNGAFRAAPRRIGPGLVDPGGKVE
jgi:hypothetical protein